MRNILVTGGTGTLGSEIVRQLLASGHEVSVLSSADNPVLPKQAKFCKGDLETNRGLQQAVKNIDTIIHCASNPREAEKIDVPGTRYLLQAAKQAGINHFVYISIVGVDQSSFPYYKAKTEVEQMIRESGIPLSILRTTQFHDFVLYRIIRSFEQVAEPNITIPEGLKFQTVDIREVAQRLVEISVNNPAGKLPDMGGPEILSLEQMTRIYLEILGRRQKVIAQPIENEFFQIFRSGINLCPGNATGKITWEKFLRNHFEIGE